MSWWILVLYHTCRVGCANPDSFTLPVVYATEQECREAGNRWVNPNANPAHSVASFVCNYVTARRSAASVLNRSKTSRTLAKFLQFSRLGSSQDFCEAM